MDARPAHRSHHRGRARNARLRAPAEGGARSPSADPSPLEHLGSSQTQIGCSTPLMQSGLLEIEWFHSISNRSSSVEKRTGAALSAIRSRSRKPRTSACTPGAARASCGSSGAVAFRVCLDPATDAPLTARTGMWNSVPSRCRRSAAMCQSLQPCESAYEPARQHPRAGRVAISFYGLDVLLIFSFSVQLGWVPPSGYVSPYRVFNKNACRMLLPAFTIATSMPRSSCATARLCRMCSATTSCARLEPRACASAASCSANRFRPSDDPPRSVGARGAPICTADPRLALTRDGPRR